MKEQKNRVNSQIKAAKVRVINYHGEQLGILSLKEAFAIRDEASATEGAKLDLVEISPNAETPVVRVMNYGKFIFQQNKQRAIAKKKQKQSKVKEIKFRPSTDVGDYEIKLRSLRNFLEAGDKVKVTVWFRGREMAHQGIGVKLIEKVRNDLTEISKVEFFPKLEGRQLIMILAPKKK